MFSLYRKEAKTKKVFSPKHESLKEPEDWLILFLHRVLQWLQANHARTVTLFRKLDQDNDGRLKAEDFDIGMRSLDVPATKAEIQELIKIVDIDGDNGIDILEFDKLIREFHRKLQAGYFPAEGKDDLHGESAVSLTFSPSRLSVKCPHCSIGLAEPQGELNSRFVKLKMTLASFKNYPKHPGHFESEVTDSTKIHSLRILIQEHLLHAVDTVALFKDSSCSKAGYLDPSSCLEHNGILGGTKACPTTAEVYYDYMPAVMDCPLLMDESHMQNTPIGTRGAGHSAQ